MSTDEKPAGHHEKERERWARETLEPVTERHPERLPPVQFSTISSHVQPRLATPVDTADLDFDRDVGWPGEYPYTRGVHPTMYRGRLWTMRQFAGFGTARDTNQRFHYLLEHGQTGLSVAFDMPTLMGLDSDDPRSLGEVGVEGVEAGRGRGSRIEQMREEPDRVHEVHDTVAVRIASDEGPVGANGRRWRDRWPARRRSWSGFG